MTAMTLAQYQSNESTADLRLAARMRLVPDRANDIFYALPDTYTKPDAILQLSNMGDAVGEIRHEEWVDIARALRDDIPARAGILLMRALKRICHRLAVDEAEDGA